MTRLFFEGFEYTRKVRFPIIAAWTCCLIVTATPAFGEDLGVETPNASVHATRHGGRVGKKFSTAKKNGRASVSMRGHCTLLESPLNPLSGPCVSVPLELKDEKGVSAGVSRTTTQGEFEFTVESEGPFTLAPTTSFYAVVSPKGVVKKGERIDLRIREKN